MKLTKEESRTLKKVSSAAELIATELTGLAERQTLCRKNEFYFLRNVVESMDVIALHTDAVESIQKRLGQEVWEVDKDSGG